MKIIYNSVLIGFLGVGSSEMIIILFIAICFGLLPTIFYLVALQKTLNKVSEENRKIPSGQVWLILIPLFGLVWHFIVVNRIADSLKAEFLKRKIDIVETRPGISLGLTFCTLYCIRIVTIGGMSLASYSTNNRMVVQFIPLTWLLISLSALICWIVYWVKISNYKSKLVLVNSSIQDLSKPLSAKSILSNEDGFIQIEKLGKLKEQGLITEEEFKEQKSKILNS